MGLEVKLIQHFSPREFDFWIWFVPNIKVVACADSSSGLGLGLTPNAPATEAQTSCAAALPSEMFLPE